MPCLNQNMLIEIYGELLRQSHEHISLERTMRLALSGKQSLNAFSNFIKTARCVTTNPDSPPRVDIAFSDERTCLSILNRHGTFGQKIIEAALKVAPRLVCERTPIWVRSALKNSLTSNHIHELEILTLDNTAVTYLRTLGKSVKRVIDHTGNLIGTVKSGSFDFVYMKKENLAWTKKFFSDMHFETKVLKIEIVENEYGFLQIESGFKNVTWKNNPRLKSIEKLILIFTLHKSNKPVIQDLIQTFKVSFPNLHTLIFEVNYNFVTSQEIEKQTQNIPKKLSKMIEAFENATIPEHMKMVKLFIETHCIEIVLSRETACPPRIRKALTSYQMITDDKRLCQWQKRFNYGENKVVRLLMNLYLRNMS